MLMRLFATILSGKKGVPVIMIVIFCHRRCRGYYVSIRVANEMFGQCPIFAYLGLRSILMLCEQAQIGEDGVLAEYLRYYG